MDGVEATQRIRAIEREQRRQPALIFGVTANVADDDLKRYRHARMDGCIVKGKLLAKALRKAVSKAREQPGGFVNLTHDLEDE